MQIRIANRCLAVLAASVWLVAGCGGGGGDAAPAPVVIVPATTTNVTVKVVDGPIRNALVCLDANGNGACDAAETQGRTDASGSLTLAVPNADVGRYPVLALVGTDAVDADFGAVATAYALSAPADQVAVVNPLTTLVQRTIALTGASSAVAAKSVQDATGITASPFQDYSGVAAPTDGSVSAAIVARLIVVATQKQATDVAATLGTMASDNTPITKANLDSAIQGRILELLPTLVGHVGDAAVTAATSAAARDAALQAAASDVITNHGGLTPAAIPVIVAINNQAAATTAVTPSAPAPTMTLHTLTYNAAGDYFVRVQTSSAAQNTPDVSNNIRYIDRRQRNISGNLAKWGTGADPTRQSDLHWNGSSWAACQLNQPNVASIRDVHGNSTYDFCDKFDTGTSSRATFDVSGRTMASVYSDVRAAGFTNLTLTNAGITLLGSATFPANSLLFYQTSTALTTSIAYYPGSPEAPGLTTVATQYSLAVSAGGTASGQAAGANCNSVESNSNGANSTTLESFIAAMSGTPCIYAPGSFVYQGVTYSSGPTNEWWGNSTANLGTLGTAPLNSGTAPGYYSGNTRLRVAFKGGANAVTYYACQERFNNGSTRNCVVIGTGTYAITTLGDARVLTLARLPVQTAPLNYTRVFVERGGLIYNGYQNKPAATGTARFNAAAANAFLSQLGLTPEDPSTPLALTAGSYQGTWDIRNSAFTSGGTTVFIFNNGTVACQDRTTLLSDTCTLTITNPATGAFTFSDTSSTAVGTADLIAGTLGGTYHDPDSVPVDGTFVGRRR